MPSTHNEHDEPGVSRRTAPAVSGPWRKEFTFCCETCKQAFGEHPDRFVTIERG